MSKFPFKLRMAKKDALYYFCLHTEKSKEQINICNYRSPIFATQAME